MDYSSTSCWVYEFIHSWHWLAHERTREVYQVLLVVLGCAQTSGQKGTDRARARPTLCSHLDCTKTPPRVFLCCSRGQEHVSAFFFTYAPPWGGPDPAAHGVSHCCSSVWCVVMRAAALCAVHLHTHMRTHAQGANKIIMCVCGLSHIRVVKCLF